MGLLSRLNKLSVDDKGAVGAASGHFEAADAAEAVTALVGAGTPVTISIEAHGLPDRDVFSKSDAMAVLFISQGGRWTESGRTETVANSLAPVFTKHITVSHCFERLQRIRVALFDVDSKKKAHKIDLGGDTDFLAHAEFVLADLLSAQGRKLTLPTADKHGRLQPGCTVTLSAEELPNSNAVVELSFAATKLENKDTFGRSDPFLRISRMHNNEWKPVLKTEVRDNDLNPRWRPIKTSMSQLCRCDEAQPLLLEVFDHDSDGGHDLIGRCEASLQQLRDAALHGHGLVLVNPKKQLVRHYVSSGTLLVNGASITPRASFLDYISGGVELAFTVAIDFTASNGDPNHPQSLHYASSQRLTIYEEAIKAVGHVIEHYDTDKSFPAFGFGAALPPANVSHCFALNGNISNPEVAGVAGILQAYRQTLARAKLSGPTFFAPIINTAAQIASLPTARPRYHVLLILTDGAIMDMAATLSAVVSASELPMSMLIVGLGTEDFAAMEALDGDKHRVKAPDGRKAVRDMVQFVALRPHQRDTVEGLAAKLLAELPAQLVQFYDWKRVPPPPPRPAFGMTPPAQAPSAQPGAGHPPSQPTAYPLANQPGATVAYPAAPQPAAYPPAQPAAFPPAQPGAPGIYPPAQPAAYPPAQPAAYPPAQPGAYPPAQPGVMPGAYPPAQGAYPPAQPAAYPPAQPAAYPPAQPGAHPPAQHCVMPGACPPAQGAYPPAQPAAYPPAQPGAYPPAQHGVTPGAYPPAQPGAYPPAQHGATPGAYPPAHPSHLAC